MRWHRLPDLLSVQLHARESGLKDTGGYTLITWAAPPKELEGSAPTKSLQAAAERVLRVRTQTQSTTLRYTHTDHEVGRGG
jgi:hypothetical protein